ncbi:unnamed protein product [Arctogadus glacialis]
MGNMRERCSRDRQLTCHRTETEMDAQAQRDPAYGKQDADSHRRQTTSAGHWLASMPLGGRQDVPGMVDPISTRPRQGQPSRLQPRTGSRCGPVRQPRA